MGRPKMDPATKRALTTLRNRGFEVNVMYAKPVKAVVSMAVVATPATPTPRTFATKAERAAGIGFGCSCGRNNLRVATHPGSFHETGGDTPASGTLSVNAQGKTIHTL